MARPLREGEVRVLVRGGTADGRSARYARKLDGLTVKEAIDKLHDHSQRKNALALPQCIDDPYYLTQPGGTRHAVSSDSTEVILAGAVFSADDP